MSPAGVTVTSIELDAPPSEAVKVTTVGVAAGATRGRTSVGAAQVGSTILGVLVVSSTSTAPCGPLLITVRKVVALVDPRPSITVAMPRGAVRAVAATCAVVVAAMPPVTTTGALVRTAPDDTVIDAGGAASGKLDGGRGRQFADDPARLDPQRVGGRCARRCRDSSARCRRSSPA